MTVAWWDWLMASAAELKALGVDPSHRMAQVGRSRPLSPQWARSVGLWAVRDAKDILAAIAPPGATPQDLRKLRYAYDVFKNRNGLWTSRNVMREFQLTGIQTHKYGRAYVGTMLHLRIEILREDNPALSIGAAAAIAVGPMKGETPIGVLPVEAVQYYHAVEHILKVNKMSSQKWGSEWASEMAWKDRRELWDEQDADQFVLLSTSALTKYASNNEEDD